ncbi:MAG: hypothetical protein KC493_05810 [Bacteriovoracaceae bacterium]|nr:hypothetical protein [Bacteriovoracaceae bacterium]
MNLDNTLEEHGIWDSEKMHLAIPVAGSSEFFESLETLKGGKLRMGEWGGYQHLTWRASQYDLPLGFNLTLLPKGTFSFFLASSNEGYFGLRISRNKAIPSGFFEVNNQGQFISFEKLNTKWEFRENSVRFHFDGSHIVVGKSIASVPERFKINGFNYLGFRSGGEQAIVSHMAMGIEPIFNIRFDFLEDLLGYLVGFSFFFASLYFAVQLNFHFRHDKVFLVLLAVSLLSFGFNQYKSKAKNDVFSVHIKKKLYAMKIPSREGKKVKIMGKYQASGNGALYFHHSIPIRLSLKESLKSYAFTFNKDIELDKDSFLNIVFIDSSETIPLVNKKLKGFEGLVLIVIEARPAGDKIPLRTEFELPNNVKIANLHQFLWSQKETGFLFWGDEELTSWGQNLASQFLEKEILKFNENK